MTSTLPKQVRQMKQGDRWRKMPIRVDHPDEPGVGYGYYLDGAAGADESGPVQNYFHQIDDHRDVVNAEWYYGQNWTVNSVHDLGIGAYQAYGRTPPDPTPQPGLAFVFWGQFRFPLNIPVGATISATILSCCFKRSVNAFGDPPPDAPMEARIFDRASTPAFIGESSCYWDRSDDQQLPVFTTVVTDYPEFTWLDFDIGALVQAFIDRPDYVPHDPSTNPNDGWMGFAIRWLPPGSAWLFKHLFALGATPPPGYAQYAPKLAFSWSEQVPGLAGSRFCVPTEAGRIHQIRMERLGVE